MKIDPISQKFLHISFSLNRFIPGLISEYWGDNKLKDEYENHPIKKDDLVTEVRKLQSEVALRIRDTQRKEYLVAQIAGLLGVALEIQGGEKNLQDFYRNVLGFKLDRLSEEYLEKESEECHKLFEKIGVKPKDFKKEYKVDEDKISETLMKVSDKIKTRVEKYVKHPKQENFTFTLVKNKPWAAFNYHMRPFESKIEINTDTPNSDLDLKLLASHEVYGGHHSELSLKDKLLVDEGRGEHSIANVYSSQAFVSEGVAEASRDIFNVFDENDLRERVFLKKANLHNMQLNNLAFYVFEDGWTRKRVVEYLKKDGLSLEKDVDNTASFVLGPIWGKYSPWYFQSRKLVLNAFDRVQNKKEFIHNIFTLPVTPQFFIDLVN